MQREYLQHFVSFIWVNLLKPDSKNTYHTLQLIKTLCFPHTMYVLESFIRFF